MSQYKELISRPEISFWVPIVTSAVIIAGSWFTLSSRIDLLSQKLDILLSNQEKVLLVMQAKDNELQGLENTHYNQMQKQWGELSQRVTRIER